MKYPNPKPGVYNHDVNTNYNSTDMIQASLFFEKMRRSVRPREIDPLAKPIPLPSKDLYFFGIETESMRDQNNPSKNIPHADYLPDYIPPYYSPMETGFSSTRRVFGNE